MLRSKGEGLGPGGPPPPYIPPGGKGGVLCNGWNMEGEIVIKRWEDLDGEVSSYRLCCLLSFHFNIIFLLKLSRHFHMLISYRMVVCILCSTNI